MKRFITPVLFAGVGMLLVSGALASSHASPPRDVTRVAVLPAVANTPPCEMTGKLADGVAAKGSELYTKKCAICHGATGDGKGPGIKRLDTPPVGWDAKRWAKTTDAEKFKATKCGGEAIGMSADMPDYPQYTDQQIWDMLAYSKTLVTK